MTQQHLVMITTEARGMEMLLESVQRTGLTTQPAAEQSSALGEVHRPAPPRSSAKPAAARGAVSGRILDAIRSGLQDVQAISDSIGAKPGSVRQALHGLIKQNKVTRTGRGRFDVIPVHVNGAAAAHA